MLPVNAIRKYHCFRLVGDNRRKMIAYVEDLVERIIRIEDPDDDPSEASHPVHDQLADCEVLLANARRPASGWSWETEIMPLEVFASRAEASGQYEDDLDDDPSEDDGGEAVDQSDDG